MTNTEGKKPSAIIKQIVPQMAAGRIRSSRAKQNGNGVIPLLMDDATARRRQSEMESDPMTWVMAVMAYLDDEYAKRTEGMVG